MKLTLNIKPKASADVNPLKDAAERKTKATETMEDAWIRILAMKNSDSEAVKLREVKHAMTNGTLGREAQSASKRFSKAEVLRLYAILAESQREQKLADLVANTPSNYRLLTNIDEVRAVVADAFNEPIIAVDTETTGLDVYVDVVVGISLTLPTKNVHYYIPIQPTEDERALPSSDVIQAIKPLMESEEVGKVFHNAIYDINMFKRHDVEVNGLSWDTQTAMHVLNENEPSYALKNLATKYLGEPSDTFAELFGKNAKFAEVPLDIALVYAAKDTDLTYRLYEFQRLHMAKMPNVLTYYESIEVPLLNVIVDLERNGYILDLDFAKKYGEELHERSQALLTELMSELSPHHVGEEPLNLNSGQQLKPVLETVIGETLPNLDAKRTLNPLRNKYPIIDKLLEYRNITKLSGTYIDALPLKQNPVTKRWHSRFNPMGTVTGRFSSGKDKENGGNPNEFNVQNQPDDARQMFVAPPGKVLASADFKAQEIRCVAYLSGEPALIEAFEKGVDPYANMASKYYKRPYSEVNKNADGSDTKERKQMKVGWLSMLYGTSKYTLADQLKTTPQKAQEFMTSLFDSMPILRDWIKDNEDFAGKYGYVWMDKEQRKRRLPDATIRLKGYGDSNFGKKNRAMRQATNARVQGSSAIQTKVTMILADAECKKREGWALWGSIHDELVFEIPEDFTKDDLDVIERIMTESYRFGDVANGTDLAIMKRWGSGVTPQEWFANKETEETA